MKSEPTVCQQLHHQQPLTTMAAANGNAKKLSPKKKEQQQQQKQVTAIATNESKASILEQDAKEQLKLKQQQLMQQQQQQQQFNVKCQPPVPVLTKIKIYALLSLVLVLAIYSRDDFDQDKRAKGIWPLEKLLNYEKFRLRYPRIKTRLRTRPSEDSRRHLLFNLDLISLGRHNLAYLTGKYSYYMRQSPFKSDRTSLEQMDVLNQLDEFNLTQILEASRMQDENGRPIYKHSIDTNDYYYYSDKPIRGLPKGEVETSGNGINKWFTRLFQGDKYFDIPNYPLDKQPDPERITHIDSDLRYCSGEIQDQGDCGACYAFSWNSLAEWHYCRQTGAQKRIDFSEQHIVDCGYKVRLEGCNEGLIRRVAVFSQLVNFELESKYPYRKKETGTCLRERGSIKVKPNLHRIKIDRLEWEETLKEQPILVEVNLPTDIMDYSRGIHPGNNCNPQKGHGMLLVGFGQQEGVAYWLLKNSMGKNWGENGYLRLAREAPMNECFSNGFTAEFKFASLSDKEHDDFYESLKFKPTIEPEKRRVYDNELMKWVDEDGEENTDADAGSNLITEPTTQVSS